MEIKIPQVFPLTFVKLYKLAPMKYYFEKKLNLSFLDSIERVKNVLKDNGLGVVSEIRMDENLNKLDSNDFKPYLILGACSPEHAKEALRHEENIGVLLPCNVVVASENDGTRVAVVNPLVAMQGVQNPALEPMAKEITEKLKQFMSAI